MEGVAVEFGVDGDGGDAELAAGADDPDGDLAAVGDQNLVEHVLMVSRMDPSGATSAARFLPSSCEVAAAARPGTAASRGDRPARPTPISRPRHAAATPRAAVLVTDHQTAGRGRLDRTWDDTAGDSLLVSFRLRGIAARRRQPGASARRRGAGGGRRGVCAIGCSAKWPNDLVVIDGAVPGKLAGVLGEFVDGDHPCVVVGIGINVRPVDGQAGATSIVECGGADDRDRLLAALLREFSHRRRDGSGVVDELRTHSATLGSRVRAELPGGAELLGDAVDLTDDGELVVRDDEGRDRIVSAGDVVHLRAV